MAEIVELQMERSMVEFEQMIALRMFDKKYIKSIISSREVFEYKLAKQEKSLRDYLEYLSFENKLMQTVQERQRNHNVEQKLELSIQKRIKRLYGMATARFPDSERLWDECFLFHKKAKADHAEIRSVLTRKRQFHGDKADCWLKAIKWEREYSTDPHKYKDVRELLQQARLRHPDCIPLSVELINLILTNPIDVELRMKQVMALYGDYCAKNTTNHLEFQLAVLEESSKHDFAGKLESQILDDMKETHWMEPRFRDLIAQRELHGLATYGGMADQKPATLRNRMKLCVEVYQAAVADIDTDEMWTFYLNAVHAINVDTNHTLLPLRRRMLGQAYKAADTQGRMDRFHYSNYVQLMYECNASDELVEPIVKRAIAKFGDSIEIWTIYMKHYMRADNADRVKEVFEQSRKRFAQTGAPLWKLYVEYVSSVTPSKVKDVYNEVLVKSNPEFDEIKMKYIDWAYSIGGIKSVLDVYNQADTMGTVTLGMVNKVNDLFLLDSLPNPSDWRNLLERSIFKFGSMHPKIWFLLIDFEKKHGEPINVSKIVERAKHTLKPDLQDTFLADLHRQQVQQG